MIETSVAAQDAPMPDTPPRKAPPIHQTPLTHKSVTQPFSMGATNKAKSIYRQIALETRGHYFVGMNPETFLEKFMPWNDSTLDPYKKKVPSKRRLDTLRSVPPAKPRGVEKGMYGPFVEALDQWITRSALKHTDVPNPQTLRFLSTQHPDTSCEGLNVDVATYWNNDLPKRATFSCQQTHEEFKADIGYDPFRCDSDEPNASEEEPLEYKEDLEDEDESDEDASEGDEDEEEGEEEEIHADATNGQAEATSDQAAVTNGQPGHNPTPDIPQTLEDRLPEGEDAAMHDEVPLPRTSASSGVETDTSQGIESRGQIAAYAGLVLSLAFRNHFFSMLILGRYARFIRWDRRGAIVTHRFDYTKRPKLIFEFYLRYGQLSLRQRGFDPMVKLWKKKLPQAVKQAFGNYIAHTWYGGAKYPHGDPVAPTERFFRIEVTDPVQERTEAFFIPAPRYSRASLFPFCRATRRSLACPEKNIEPKESTEEPNDSEPENIEQIDTEKLSMCFLKESWQEESLRTAPEADIYRLLKEKKVQHVASMRLGGDVQSLETETQNWFSELSHKSRHRKLGKMVCHRIVLDTVARDLSTFTWCKVLLSCIADAVEAAQQAYSIGILHRDLSAGNMMIVRDKNTKAWRGVLIDWDMCLIWKKRGGQARTGRTGTWAFISAKILLTKPPVRHTLWDDMESAFWVLVYHTLRYTKNSTDPQLLYKLMQDLFAAPVLTDDGPASGGLMKRLTILSCATGRSIQLSRFKVTGLNKLLNKLGVVFDYRYTMKEGDEDEDKDEDKDEDENEDKGKDEDEDEDEDEDKDEDENEEDDANEDKDEDENEDADETKENEEDEDEDEENYPTNLNDPNVKWFPDSLREAALAMKPLCITPTGLKSLTNDSRPPVDHNDWQPASVSDKNSKADWYSMPWASNPEESSRVQKHKLGSITSSIMNYLDGSSIHKRPHIGDPSDKDDEPSHKKRRKERKGKGRKDRS